MPITLSEFLAKTKKTEVELGDDVLNITFKTGFYTPAVRARIDNAENPMDEQVAVMADAITDWDFVDEKGKAIPVTVETLSGLGVVILNIIFLRMIDESRPNPQKADS
jgi:hypothetical protein